jgi:uncharacterized protein (TIGR02145 family)
LITVYFDWNTCYSLDDITVVPVGSYWFMDRNLGVDLTVDPNPATYNALTEGHLNGGLYQWGRVGDGHQHRNSEVINLNATGSDMLDAFGQVALGEHYGKFITNNTGHFNWRSTDNNLWNGTDGGSGNPCPAGYRVPTSTEWSNILSRILWNGSKRGLVGSGADADFYLPAAGIRESHNGNFRDVNVAGFYWTSTAATGNLVNYLNFHQNGSKGVGSGTGYRTFGASVRCIRK